MKKTSLLLLLLVITSLYALRALFTPEFYTNHDGITHTARIANYFLALKEGQYPPRLAPNLFGSLGFPIFIFIYPLPYFLGSIAHQVGFSFTQSFEIVIGLSFVLSAVTMFLFAKELFGVSASFMAALFYTWAPYRFSQIYVRAAIAESFAYIFIPLILLSLFKLTKTKQSFRWIGIGSLSLSGLLLSHQLVSLMFLPIIISFGLIFLLQAKKKLTFLLQSLSLGILGFLSSAFIYFPALFERNNLQFDNLISYFQDHFITLTQLIHSPWSYGFSMKGAQFDDMSFQIGLTHLLNTALAILLIMLELYRKKRKVYKNNRLMLALLSLIVFSFSVVLMLDYQFVLKIWNLVPGLKIIDLPWRLLGVSVFSSSLLAAYTISKTKSKLVFVILLFFVFYANRNHLRINKSVEFRDDYFLNYQETATWQNEFLPRWRITNKWQNIEQNFRVSKGDIEIKPETLKTNQIVLNSNSNQEGVIEIHRLYFPGWKVWVDGKLMQLDKDFEITKNIQLETEELPFVDRSGLLSIPLEKGNHKIEVKFTETLLRKVGFTLSLAAFTVSVLLLTPKNYFIKIFSLKNR